MNSADDLRALRARRQVTLYELGADLKINPGRLGQILLGKVAMPPGLAERIAEAIERRAATGAAR